MTENVNAAPDLVHPVRLIVQMLVACDYTGIERASGGRRLNAADLEAAVAEYGRTLVMPPRQAFLCLDAVEIVAPGPRSWDIRFDLWTAEEGRSDLTLELTITECGEGTFSVAVDDLHVL